MLRHDSRPPSEPRTTIVALACFRYQPPRSLQLQALAHRVVHHRHQSLPKVTSFRHVRLHRSLSSIVENFTNLHESGCHPSPSLFAILTHALNVGHSGHQRLQMKQVTQLVTEMHERHVKRTTWTNIPEALQLHRITESLPCAYIRVTPGAPSIEHRTKVPCVQRVG